MSQNDDISLVPLGGLAVEEGPDTGLVVAVGERPVTVGRETSCEVRLTDTSASRRHVRVSAEADGTVTLEDMSSANGTFLNDTRVDKAVLKSGDRIRLGETTIRFLSEAELLAALRSRTDRVIERDGVTEASSRRIFDMRLRTELALAARKGDVVSLVVVALDRFDLLLAKLGDSGGERVLRAVALGLGGYLHENDMLARIEDDAFAVLVPDPSPNQAFLMAERMCAGVESLRIDVEGKTVSISASIGVVSEKGRRDLLPERLIDRAWNEVQRARDAGGACVSRWVHPLAREPIPSVSGDLRGTVLDLTRKR